jgi:hypothetical protein
MNKMAVFVEGYTEVVFVDKLIREIANENSVRIQWRRIDGGTTCPRYNHDDMQLRLTPANDLNNCYAIGGQAYVKGNAQATVNALDFAHVYAGLVDRFPYLMRLCNIIEHFLAA